MATPPIPNQTVLQRIENALGNLLTLKIVTIVGPVSVTDDNGSPDLLPVHGSNASGISTTIRLEQGDITNILSEEAFENKALSDYHGQQVTTSRQIVADNLKALLDLARSMTS